MLTVRERAAFVWGALGSPWGIVTTWHLLLLWRQLTLGAQLLLAGGALLGLLAGTLAALGALLSSVVLLRGARVGYGPWDSRLSVLGALSYVAAEALARWPWGFL